MKYKLTMRRIAYQEREVEVEIDDDEVAELGDNLHGELERLGEEESCNMDWTGCTKGSEYELEGYQEAE